MKNSYFCGIRMRRYSHIRLLFTGMLTSIMLMMVSIHEVHYLFTEHHTHEECHELHLHAADEHGHCPVCKFDISLFTDEIEQPIVAQAPTVVSTYNYTYLSVQAVSNTITYPLRGPPSQA
jgi:hypothetical protein